MHKRKLTISFIIFTWSLHINQIHAKLLTFCKFRNPPSGYCNTNFYRFSSLMDKTTHGNSLIDYPLLSEEDCYNRCLSNTACYGVDMTPSRCYLNNAFSQPSVELGTKTSRLDCCNTPGRILPSMHCNLYGCVK
jgi:hypothetical protein